MKRFVLVGLIWVLVVGGMGLYMHQRRSPVLANAGVEHLERAVSMDDCSLEVTTTFDLEPDPFALRTGDGTHPNSLTVNLGDQTILARNDDVKAGMPILVTSIGGLKQGLNELFLEANPPLADFNRSFAVRVRVFCGDQPVTDQTIWSDQGGKAAGTVMVDLDRMGG